MGLNRHQRSSAMVGLYTTMALAVTRRSREMGIRMALGAQRAAIVREILFRGLGLVGTGIVLGVGISVVAGTTLSSMLFQIRPTDPLTYVVVAALTAVVAIFASYLPARRASRLDPMKTLQEEVR